MSLCCLKICLLVVKQFTNLFLSSLLRSRVLPPCITYAIIIFILLFIPAVFREAAVFTTQFTYQTNTAPYGRPLCFSSFQSLSLSLDRLPTSSILFLNANALIQVGNRFLQTFAWPQNRQSDVGIGCLVLVLFGFLGSHYGISALVLISVAMFCLGNLISLINLHK